jgi:hypothetical protein
MPYPAGSFRRAAIRTSGFFCVPEKCAIDSMRPDV